MACNDIVLAGSFHREGTSWITSPVSDLPHFEPVEGYDGWYVCSFAPEAEPDAEKGMQAKPIMLDVDGNFNWEYQIGAATAIRGGVQVVQGAYSGEIDLINYTADAPNVFTVDAWKQNPCTAVYHNYSVTVISDGCGGYVVPFIVGGMTGWTFTQMQLDAEASISNGAPTYYYNFKAAEGTPYQIVSGLMGETGEIETEPAWADDAYLQKNVEGQWVRYPGEEGDNTLTHEDANILYDLRAEDLRWARCDDSPLEHVVLRVNLPAENCPEAVEIIGGFDAWEGTAMEHLDNGLFFAEIEAKQGMFFKFRGAGSWDHELELYNAEDDVWSTIADGQLTFGQLWQDDTYNGTPCKSIELDFSAGRWSGYEEGIENVVLTEKAQKVMVDGVMYIIRDNKLFNVQGTQVR
jgi:hypothetical protein